MPFGKITSLKAFSGLERLDAGCSFARKDAVMISSSDESDRADRALLDMPREKEGPERPLKTYVVGLMH
jgi:hypothetical protein